jgi:hypothetical protein
MLRRKFFLGRLLWFGRGGDLLIMIIVVGSRLQTSTSNGYESIWKISKTNKRLKTN